MFQSLVERRIGLAAVSAPYSISDASRGAGDLIGSVAIFWNESAGSPACSVIERGRAPSRGGSIRVAQHQPDGVCLLPEGARGLHEKLGRLSVTLPRGLQRSLNGVGLP